MYVHSISVNIESLPILPLPPPPGLLCLISIELYFAFQRTPVHITDFSVNIARLAILIHPPPPKVFVYVSSPLNYSLHFSPSVCYKVFYLYSLLSTICKSLATRMSEHLCDICHEANPNQAPPPYLSNKKASPQWADILVEPPIVRLISKYRF